MLPSVLRFFLSLRRSRTFLYGTQKNSSWMQPRTRDAFPVARVQKSRANGSMSFGSLHEAGDNSFAGVPSSLYPHEQVDVKKISYSHNTHTAPLPAAHAPLLAQLVARALPPPPSLYISTRPPCPHCLVSRRG
jgi:hypothetical protein